LRKGDSFVPLREEFEFVDDYLDIEVVRFGGDKLKVVKELDPASLEAMVPSVILQPLVENAVKHGLSPKVEGGTIYLRSRIQDNLLVVEVEDDGVGITESASSSGTGIGMANVRERLNVLYNDLARVEVESSPHAGTIIRLVLPVPQTLEEGGQAFGPLGSTNFPRL
jgi:two-component system LytT family sensor kinase